MFRNIIVALLLVLAPAAQAVEDTQAGRVTRIKPSAIAIQDAMPRKLAVGSPIFINDIISTGLGSRLEIKMIDDTVLTLGERTQFVVLEYRFKDQNGSAALRLLSGSLKAASGKLAALDARNFKLITDVATIGVRGTVFWVGPFAKVPHVQLLSGKGVYVENKMGRVEIRREGWGTFIQNAETAPTKPEYWPKAMNDMVNKSMSFD